MEYCPIQLTPLKAGEQFSPAGLKSLHPKLRHLKPLPYSQEEQLEQARLRADKMSIQGVQPKLSATLNITQGVFKIVDNGGTYILKPNPPTFEDVPANESLTMTMAHSVGITTPPHGLISTKDAKWVYVIKRFDRTTRKKRLHLEDFAQLTQATRETKYDSSLEKVAKVVSDFCTFPALEHPRLALRLLFCFLSGNEDMHLKNSSLMRHEDGTVTLSPAYDLLNSTLVLKNATEESALPLGGRKRNLTLENWTDFLSNRLSLSGEQIESTLSQLTQAFPTWRKLIDASYLPEDKRTGYHAMLTERAERLQLKME